MNVHIEHHWLGGRPYTRGRSCSILKPQTTSMLCLMLILATKRGRFTRDYRNVFYLTVLKKYIVFLIFPINSLENYKSTSNIGMIFMRTNNYRIFKWNEKKHLPALFILSIYTHHYASQGWGNFQIVFSDKKITTFIVLYMEHRNNICWSLASY